MLKIKKISQVALVGLGLLASVTSPSHAEATPPTLKISGFSVVDFYGISQSNRANGKGAGYHLANDVSDLYFIIAGKTANDFGYKYEITFEAIPGEGLNVAQNFIQLDYNGAIIQAGAVGGYERSGLMDATRILGGTGGFSGGVTRVYNYSAGTLEMYRLIGETKYSTKVVVWTPQYYGLRFVLGFTPHTAHNGDKKLNTAATVGNKNPGNSPGIYPTNTRTPFGRNNIVVGLGYHNETGDWNIKASAAGIFDKSYLETTDKTSYSRVRVRDTRSYQLGAIIGYGKVQVAGGYQNNGNSRMPTDALMTIDGVSLGNTWQGDAGHLWNAGASYTIGAYQFAVAHQRTSRKTDAINRATSDITTVTFDIRPIQGLTCYVEGDYIKTRTNAGSMAIVNAFNAKNANQLTQAIGNNEGKVAVVGMKVAF